MNTPKLIPDHPFATFREGSKNFAQKSIPSPVKRFVFLQILRLWERYFGVAKFEKKILTDLQAGQDGFAHEKWIFKNLFQIENLASFVLQADQEKDPIRKAAQVLDGTLKFREDLLAGNIPMEYAAGKPQDMARYQLFFSRITLSARRKTGMLHRIVNFEPSSHVVIGIDGIFYSLQVIVNHKRLDYPELLDQISAIAQDARDKLDTLADRRSPFGLLSSLHNKKSNRLFQLLKGENAQTFDQLNKALFFLGIDIHDQPQSLDRTLRSIHVENYHNRDNRRSMQIIVTGNGRAAVVVNPHAGIGGSFSTRLASDLFKHCQVLAASSAVPISPLPVLFRQLEFRQNSLARAQKELSEVEAEVQKQIYPRNTVTAHKIERVGKADFAPYKLSADGVFHCALHLAYKRCFGHAPQVGNFINLRNVMHGDIWRYNSTSPEMLDFVKTPSLHTLEKAASAHKNLVKEHKKADDPFYLIALNLMRLICEGDIPFSAFIALMLTTPLFVKDFFRRFINPHLWVSHIPELEGVEITGRASVRFAYLDKNSLGGHYMIFDDHIHFCFLGSVKDNQKYGLESGFADTLQACLCEIKQMVNTAPRIAGAARADVEPNVHPQSSPVLASTSALAAE